MDRRRWTNPIPNTQRGGQASRRLNLGTNGYGGKLDKQQRQREGKDGGR